MSLDNEDKQIELDEVIKEIEAKFKTKVIDSWIPADGLLEKCCLFVRVESQDKLVNNIEDFELKLYVALEEKLEQSRFFNMIALL